MLLNTLRVAALALLLVALACSEHPQAPAPSAADRIAALPVTSAASDAEQLARSLALALGDSAFRTYVKAQLDASPFREHKLPFQRFLAANGDRAAAALAQTARATPAAMRRAADAAIPLEFYFPVPAHRAAWGGAGDERVLVATAIGDHDAPVAFDPQGHRLVLSPAEPPATPVLALVPVETDFSVPPPALLPAALTVCWDYCPQPYQPPPPPPPAGLYMTQAHFPQTFEG